MLCPIISYQYTSSGITNCMYEDCAWFCPDSKMCEIKKIALKDELIMPVVKDPVSHTRETMLFNYGS